MSFYSIASIHLDPLAKFHFPSLPQNMPFGLKMTIATDCLGLRQ